MGLFHPSSSSNIPSSSPIFHSSLTRCNITRWILLFQVLVIITTITIVSSSHNQGSYEDPLLRVGDRIHLPDYSSYVLDSTFHQAKDIVVNKRKLEADLVRKGIYTDMSKRTAVTRHQAVTTTFNNVNELDKNQEVFEEMTKLLARK